mgnify:CR=1 FL=1
MNDNTWIIVNLVWADLALIACQVGLRCCVNIKGIPGILRLITLGVIIMIDGIILVSLLFMISLIVQIGSAIW